MQRSLPAWQVTLEAERQEPSLRRLAFAGIGTIALGFGGFFLWAASASLDSAVPASGTIVNAGKRKTISLLESGILSHLLVKEGELVKAGQVLMRLDDTQAQAVLGQVQAQYWSLVSRIARLEAEQAERRELVLPPAIVEAAEADDAVAAIVGNERKLLASRWRTLDDTLAVQAKRITQLEEQAVAQRALEEAATKRLALLQEQLRGYRQLLAKGYMPRNKVLDMEGAEAELRGSMGSYGARYAELQQGIAQAELEKTRIASQWRSDLERELTDARGQVADLAERMRGASEVVRQRQVIAPEAGTVTDIRYFTPGSSIVAGQPVLDLVPADGRMLVEVHVRPSEIEGVQVGQDVNLRLTSYKQRKVPVLQGKLSYVSADRQTDPQGESYFLARAELAPEALQGLDNVTLTPGMPAEVLILGGERKALDYLLSPITDSLYRALREG